MTGVILFLSFAIMVIIGVPIAVSLGLSAIICYLQMGVPVSGAAQKLFIAMDGTSLMAIPLFILAGSLMSRGGISKRLANLMNDIVGGIRGGMAVAAILGCAVFAALCGSGAATVTAMTSIFYPTMTRLGYPPERSAGLTAVAGSLGPIIPPSIVMMVYATTVGASVEEMFLAGTGIGLIMVGGLIIACLIYAHKEKWPKNEKKFSLSCVKKSFLSAIPALIIPFVILGGIFSGIFTATESAAIAVVCAVVISVYVYKEISIKDIPEAIFEAAKNSTMVMLIIAASSVFGWIFTAAGLSNAIVTTITGMHLSSLAFVLVVALVMFIFGLFMDGMATILLIVPVLWPIASAMGINPIYFGMVITLGVEMGAMTPPVASNVFCVSSVTKLPVERILKGEIPFFIVMILLNFLVIFFPGLSTMLL